MFEYAKNYEYLEDISTLGIAAPRYSSLEEAEVEMITNIGNIQYFCKLFGIPYKFPATPLGEKIKASQRTPLDEAREFTLHEFAEFYVRTFLSENRADATDFVNPIPYVAP